MFFVKSFEEDFSTKMLVGRRKVTCQTVTDIVRRTTLRPNTKSFGQRQRLSTTILHPNYTKTYRPQGIIFTTSARPDFVLPFDLVLLSDAKKIVVHYFRIKKNLHLYYNHALIPGFEKFVFKNLDALVKKFPTPAAAWQALNTFRAKAGYAPLPRAKFRLAQYNEAVFTRAIKIKPVALFGYRPRVRTLGQQLNLKVYRSAQDFFAKNS